MRGATLIACLAFACSSETELDQWIKRLDGQRSTAIEWLVSHAKTNPRARTRVIDALATAYRSDKDRPRIVEALARLDGVNAARHVFQAAVKDAERDGTFLAAATLAAKHLGRLESHASGGANALLQQLKRFSQRPDPRHTYFMREAIQSLSRLRYKPATDVLTQIALRKPTEQDGYLNRLAVLALADVAGVTALPTLTAALALRKQGLDLRHAVRQALCNLGNAGATAIAAGYQRLSASARAASWPALMLLDHKQRSALLKSAGDQHGDDMALSRLQLAIDSNAAIARLFGQLQDSAAPLTQRLAAADLLGIHGDQATADRLRTLLQPDQATVPALRWRIALAYYRATKTDGISAETHRADPALYRAIKNYSVRLQAAKCLPKRCNTELTHKNWRVRERAALELSRQTPPAMPALTGLIKDPQPEVRRAVFERLWAIKPAGQQAAIVEILQKVGQGRVPSDARSRADAVCLAQLWTRAKGEASR